MAPKPKSLARNNKARMGCSGSNNLAGDFDCLAMEMPTPPKRSYSALWEPCIMQVAKDYYHRRQLAAAIPPRSLGGPRMTDTVEYTRNKLLALRLQPRKPGWDAKVRADAITAIVDLYYGPERKVSLTEAFLELLIRSLEDPKKPRDAN